MQFTAAAEIASYSNTTELCKSGPKWDVCVLKRLHNDNLNIFQLLPPPALSLATAIYWAANDPILLKGVQVLFQIRMVKTKEVCNVRCHTFLCDEHWRDR